MAVNVPAVAVKLAVLAPAATLTEPGTVNAELLDDRLTVTLDAAAWFKATVQALVPPGLTVEGVHCREDTVVGTTRDREAVCELAPKDAVRVAV